MHGRLTLVSEERDTGVSAKPDGDNQGSGDSCDKGAEGARAVTVGLLFHFHRGLRRGAAPAWNGDEMWATRRIAARASGRQPGRSLPGRRYIVKCFAGQFEKVWR